MKCDACGKKYCAFCTRSYRDQTYTWQNHKVCHHSGKVVAPFCCKAKPWRVPRACTFAFAASCVFWLLILAFQDSEKLFIGLYCIGLFFIWFFFSLILLINGPATRRDRNRKKFYLMLCCGFANTYVELYSPNGGESYWWIIREYLCCSCWD